MYADRMTDSMNFAIGETNRRRAKQVKYNTEHGIVPISIHKAIRDITDSLSAEARENARTLGESRAEYRTGKKAAASDREEVKNVIAELEKQMKEAAKNLEFEKAAAIREMYELKGILADDEKLKPWERIKLLSGREE
jgi:excinuclease ABC subunit B